MSASVQTQPHPGPLPTPRKTSAQVDRTMPKRRKVRAKKHKAASAAIPGTVPLAPPRVGNALVSHRMAKLPIPRVAQGVAALTSAFVAFKADFIQTILAAGTAPTEPQCVAWVGMFKADLDGACQSLAKAA